MRPDFSAARFRRFGGWNRRARLIAILAIILSASSGAFAASTPYTGTPTPVPGQINAEVFDNGGEGVAYICGAYVAGHALTAKASASSCGCDR